MDRVVPSLLDVVVEGVEIALVGLGGRWSHEKGADFDTIVKATRLYKTQRFIDKKI